MTKALWKKSVCAAVLAGFICSQAFANPTFTRTENGSIQIDINGSVYTINASDRAIGLFSAFGNNPGETINIHQGSPEFTALFRVIGSDPSIFYGALNADSRIFLINQNGIVFGQGSQINAAGLVASTLDIADSDFLAGRYLFQGDPLNNGYILNQGNITSHGGYIALLANAVSNEGMINADGGDVVLGAGERMLLSLDGTGLVSVEIENPTTSGVTDFEGNAVRDAVSNSGIIRATGGKVLLTAKAAENVFDNTINHSGVIEAKSFGDITGQVTLDGGDQGITRVSGLIDVSGKNAGETGGTVNILGDKVGLFGHASVDVSGGAGGGTVLVGGDLHGEGDVPTASRTFIGQDVVINADAITSGDGGKVVVWADENTRYYGHISARGGSLSGNGGFVEISGRENLSFQGSVDLLAQHGIVGNLLLDPDNITIADTGADDGQIGGADGDIVFADGVGTDFTISDEALESVTGNILLQAGFDITVNVDLNLILQTSGETVTFQAGDDIIINNAITTGGAALILNANDNGGGTATGTGDVDINAAINTGAGAFTSSGVAFDNTGGSITADDVTINHTGAITAGGNITASGNINIDSTSTFTSTAGTIITGGGAGSTFTIDAAGITVNETASGALRQTGADGTMALTATGATSVSLANNAINIADGALTITANGGNINGVTDEGTAEITANGDVTLSARGIGNTNQIEIGGDASNNNTLTLDSKANTGQAVNVELVANQFNAFTINLDDADTNVDVDLFGGTDVIDINGAAALSTLNSVVLTDSNASFTFSLDEAATDIAITSVNVDGNVSLTATREINGSDDATGELNVDGNLTLTAQGIGNTAQIEVTGDGSANSTFTIHSTATTGQAVNVELLTDQFSTMALTLDDADSNADVILTGGDVIDINGAAATSTVNNIVMTNTDINFTYTLSQAATSIAVTNIDADAGSVSLVASGGGISLANGAIDINAGALSLSALGATGAINGTGNDGVAEITADGNVTLIGAGIGSGTQVEIDGDASGDSTLTIDSRAAAGEAVNVETLTDQFSAITMNLDDADSNVDIILTGGDLIDINGAAATNTLNNLILTSTDVNFTYTLDEVGSNVSINNLDADAGNVSVTTAGGNITVAAAGGGIVSTGASAVTLVAGGATGSIAVNDAITTVNGNIIIRANDDVSFGAAGDVSSGGGSVTVKADFDDQANGTGGAILMNDGALIDAGAGTISLTADENITLGGLLTTNATNTAVVLTSTSGAIVDGGDTLTDVSAVNGRLVISSVTGAGSANALDVDVSSLSAAVTGAGNIGISDANAITVTSATTANGSIDVSAGGLLTATSVNASGVGSDVTLSTTAGGMVLTSVLADDDITITADAGDLSLGVIGDAGTDDVSLTATAGSMTDLNGSTLNITADVLSFTAFGDIGTSSDPIEFVANSFTYNITGSGTAYLNTQGSSILNVTTGGNIVFTTSGDLHILNASALNGSITLSAGGSILADNDNVVLMALNDIRLTAGGTIGTVDRPIRIFTTQGRVYAFAGSEQDMVSVNMLGNVSRSNVEFLNVPPGIVLYNHSLIGGGLIEDLIPPYFDSDPVLTPTQMADYAKGMLLQVSAPCLIDDSALPLTL